jgi:protein-S-isoprenylcysteine O-methyltransferase Ste14
MANFISSARDWGTAASFLLPGRAASRPKREACGEGSVKRGHVLVTGGIFAHLRHPIYTGMAAFLAAMAIAFGHAAHLVAAAPLFALGTWIRVREEERLLKAQFGPAYQAYAARVKRFVPGVI